MAAESGFTHLHLHSQYSVLDGAIRMKDLIPAIQERGMNQVAVTDHGNMYGAVDMTQRAAAINSDNNSAKPNPNKFKPIYGCEAYVAGDKGRTDRSQRMSSHLVLLAKDNEGYKNLQYLISMGFTEGFYYNPRIDKELLRKHSKGLIGLSACLGGVVNKPLLREGESAAAKAAREYKDIFEPGSFFLEIQDNGYKEQVAANQTLLEIGRTYDIPMVATADAHYINPDEAEAHEILMCIQQNRSLEDFRAKGMHHSEQLYIKTPQEMWDSFGRLCPEALENSVRIGNMCNVELSLKQAEFLPNYGVPDGFSEATYLEKLSYDGLRQRIKEANYPVDEPLYKQRLEYELGVINQMGFPGYFLIVWDFINYSKKHGIPVGPGRGSGAGSLVAYALRITDLDPIPYDLIFERFLNPERVSMPDFDIDFCQERRGEVLDYVSRHYGEKNVGQIATYAELSTKSVIKDVGRVLGIPFAEINALTKHIPGLVNGKKPTIDQAMELEPKLKEIQKSNPVYEKIISNAKILEGLHRGTGMHAAGIVIAESELWNYVPVCRGKNGELVTQYAKDEVEEAGLVKFDFLGLKTLTVVAKAVAHIQAKSGPGPHMSRENFDIDKIPQDDQNIYKMISKGLTDGVFQLESDGFKKLLKRLKPDCFEDVVAAVALYRPGPLDAGMVDDYIDRKHGRKKIEYPHPVCEPILNMTYGVIVYQEQVMRIAVDLSGFTLGGADKLRKAMGKKKADVMEKLGKQFVDGAYEKSGMPREAAYDLFENIKKFAGYAFNKSHSAAYAVITYQTAYLKYYYETEFMAALLSTEMRQQENVVKYIQSAREMGIPVLSPDVNQSERDFSVVNVKVDDATTRPGILFGLGAIKGVGDSAIELILEERDGDGYESLFKLCEATDTRKVNKKVLEALVKSGACDTFGRHRSQLFGSIEKALESGQAAQKDRATGQTSLFGAFAEAETALGNDGQSFNESYPDIPEWEESEKLQLEKAALGFYISGHPLRRFENDLPRLASTNVARLLENASQSRSFGGGFERKPPSVTLGCIVSELRERPLKNGNGRMAIAQVEDLHGSIEVLVFSRAFGECEDILKSDQPLLVTGSVKVEGDDPANPIVKLNAQNIQLLSKVRIDATTRVEMRIPVYAVNNDRLEGLKDILSDSLGEIPTTLTIFDPDRSETTLKLPDRLRVRPSDELITRVDNLFELPVTHFK